MVNVVYVGNHTSRNITTEYNGGSIKKASASHSHCAVTL